MGSEAALRQAGAPAGSTPPPAAPAAPPDRRSRSMRLRHAVEYGGLVVLSALTRILPRRLALVVGASLGQVGWLLRLRRRLVLANLRQALPDTSEAERRAIGARAARNFGRTAVEYLRFAGRDRARVGELVSWTGIDQLSAALEAGRGALVVAAHLGAWALYVPALTARGIATALLVGRQHNPRVDELILSLPGSAVRFISKGRASPRGVLRSLEENRAVVLVADQRSPRGIEVPFLGRTATTLPLPAAIAARHGTPLFLLEGHRRPDGRHDAAIRFLPVPRRGRSEADVRTAIAVAVNDALGQAILKYPDQYFWYHDRWRRSRGEDTPPDDLREPIG